MTSVSGLLKIGEAQATVQSIAKRQRGSQYIFYLLQVVLLFGGMLMGCAITTLVLIALDAAKISYGPGLSWQGSVIGGWVGIVGGFIAYKRLGNRLIVARFRKRLVEKGSPPELPLCMEIAPETLLYDVGDVKHIAKWSCVSEVFPKRGYWIFLAQSSPCFAPKRFFADTDAERAFLKEALAHMSEAARTRSKEAMAFAERK